MRRSWRFVTLVITIFVFGIVPETEQSNFQYAEIPKECPIIDPINETIHLAHEWDCTKFYKCDHGKPVLFECPLMDAKGNRLHFNPILQVCDWPEDAGCINGEKPTTSEKTTEGSTTPTPITSTSTESSSTSAETTPTNIPTTSSPTSLPTSSPSTSTESSSTSAETTPTNIPTTSSPTSLPTSSPSTSTESSSTSAETTPTNIPTTSSPTSLPTSSPSTSTESSSTSAETTPTNIPTTSSPTSLPTSSPSTSTESSSTSAETTPTNIPTTSSPTSLPTSSPSTSTESSSTSAETTPTNIPTTSSPTSLPTSSPSTSISTTELTTISVTDTTSVVTDEVIQNSTAVTPSGNFIPHETNCSLFWEVVGDEKILRECARGLHFSPTLEKCVWPDEAGCLSTTPIPPETTTPSGPTCGYPCGDICHGMVTAHECSCDKFYRCSNGDLILQQCPIGLHFNPSISGCDWPESAGCLEATKEPDTAEATTTVIIPTECPPVNSGQPVQIPHPSNCSLFYKCENGKKILSECPDDLHFNPILQMCDWADSAGCVSTTFPTTDGSTAISTTANPESETRTTPIAGPNECPPDNSGPPVQLPHPYDCSLFYKCDYGEKVVQSCPPGLEFNAKEQQCDWPESAKCIASTWDGGDTTESIGTSTKTTENGNVDTTTVTIPTECPPDNSGPPVHLPHPYDCSLFYKCDNGEKVVQSCPPGLEFNAKEQQCDWPESAKCTASTWDGGDTTESIATSTKTTENGNVDTTTVTIPTECPPDNSGPTVHLPHPYNCSLYYKCDNGEKILQACSPALEFNPIKQVCDWPEDAGCVVSTTEEPGTTGTWITTISTSTEGSTPPNTSTERPTRPSTTPTTLPDTSTSTRPPTTPSTPPNTSSERPTRPPTTPTTLPDTSTSTRPPTTPSTPPNTSSERPTRPSTIPTTLPDTSTPTRPPTTPTTLPDTSTSTRPPATPSTPPNTSSERPTRPPTTPTTLPDTSTPTRPSTTPEIWTTYPSSPSSSTPNPAFECPPDSTGLHIPHETNCSLYYECNNGKKQLKECTPGLHFNPLLEICDWPEFAGCQSTTITPESSTDKDISTRTTPGGITYTDDFEGEETSTSTTMLSTIKDITTVIQGLPKCIGTCPINDPMDYTVLLPNEDCTKFCKCSNSLAYVYDCPAKLHFNPLKFVCDYPRRAKCQGHGGYGRP